MGWLRNKPFKDHDEAISNLLALLSVEVEIDGPPFTNNEREILTRGTLAPTALQERVKNAIKRIYEKEKELGETDPFDHPQSFSNSLLYAMGSRNANIVELATQAADEEAQSSKLHGWRLVLDRTLLVFCGLGLVLTIFVAAYFFSK